MSGLLSSPRLCAATVLFGPDPLLLSILLETLATDGCRLIAFANGPLDSGVEHLLTEANNVRLLRAEVNVGLGAGLNAAIEAAICEGFDSVFLFDQDSSPRPGFLLTMGDRMAGIESSGYRLAVLGPLLVPPEGSTFLPIKYWRRSARPGEPPGAVEFLPTSGSLLSLAAWRDVGPLRADYFIDGIDVEWGYRAWHRGWASVLAEDLELLHRWGEECPCDAGGPRGVQAARQPENRLFYYVRNATYGMRLRHMPLKWKLRQILRMAVQIGIVVSIQRRGGFDLMRCAIADGRAGRLGPVPSKAVKGQNA